MPVIQRADRARPAKAAASCSYLWQKPSTRDSSTPKLGYVIALPRWNWMIGTGLYLDDIQATLTQIDRQVGDNVDHHDAVDRRHRGARRRADRRSGLALNLSDAQSPTRKLQLLARQVVKSQEDERAHLSRELHDSTSQTLVSIKLLLESAAASSAASASARRALLRRALQRLGEALHEVRRISHRLRPAELDTLGLPAALERPGPRSSPSPATMRVRAAACAGEPTRLPDEVNTVLFRVAQEALTNIEKHAQAQRVQRAADLPRRRRCACASSTTVSASTCRRSAVDPRRGIGMRNMRERVESIGGSFSIESRPGRTAVLADMTAAAIERLSDPTAEDDGMTDSHARPARRRPPAGARGPARAPVRRARHRGGRRGRRCG